MTHTQTQITAAFDGAYRERLKRARSVRERVVKLVHRWDALTGDGWTTPPPIVDETAKYADRVLNDPQGPEADRWLAIAEESLDTAADVVEYCETEYEPGYFAADDHSVLGDDP